ncbi:MAG: TetR/AcrR family transcriptional regulator [Novosphingobium sp.]|nr:TetR/AcrR family transcriptional regulator [Novosphingobium sp.]
MVNRRIGKEDSETRQHLLEAAEQLMREEGYAAVTSRKLASFAGLKPQLVHYYFRTMDELFEALFKRVADKHLSALKEVSAQENPLVGMFELSCDSANSVLHLEFLALANHRKNIHDQVTAFGRELNRTESAIILDVLRKEGIETPGVAPEDLSTIIETMARGMAFAENLNARPLGNARNILTGCLAKFSVTLRALSEFSDAD